MCVLAFAWMAHPRWRMVMAGNRDELHARPAEPLARWQDGSGIIAGRDLEAGGTWAGISQAGRFAVVTNLRGYGLPVPGRLSRGELVGDFLSGSGELANPSEADLGALNPFNLITADRRRAWFYTNRPDARDMELAPGIYGLSNGGLDEPWPKTVLLRNAMADWLRENGSEPAQLLDALRSEELEDAEPDDPAEPAHTPIFIRNPVYGTRCSTVVAVDHDGKGVIIERSFAADGSATGDKEIAFKWDI